MKKFKVMHVLCMGAFSGAENVAITLIDSLKNEVDSVYVSPMGSIHDVLEEHGIKHYIVSQVSISNIIRAIKDEAPDIIHAHDFTAGVIASLSTAKIPIISHLHSNPIWIKKMNLKTIMYGLSSIRYKKIVSVSDSVMDEYIFGKMLKKKSIIIPNPIDIESILEKADKAELNQKSDIVFLGRLSVSKNPIFFIEIVKKLVSKYPALRVFIIGDGELREEVEKKINEYKLGNNIRLWGFQKNPYGLLKNTKLVCMTSNWEGFGLAAVEGLSLGKPVVAKNVGGLKKIVNNSCGALCETKEQFVMSLEQLLTDENSLNQKSTEAKKRALNYGNVKSCCSLFYEIYKSVI